MRFFDFVSFIRLKNHYFVVFVYIDTRAALDFRFDKQLILCFYNSQSMHERLFPVEDVVGSMNHSEMSVDLQRVENRCL